MSRIATLKFDVQKTKGNVGSILLYLASDDPKDLWSRKIAVVEGKGSCQIPAPGRYVLTWYLHGSPGGALRIRISDGGQHIDTLEIDETAIPEGEDDNYGLLKFELEG